MVEPFIALCRWCCVDAVIARHFDACPMFKKTDTTCLMSTGPGADLYAPLESGGNYHYVRFMVTGDNVSYEAVRLNSREIG